MKTKIFIAAFIALQSVSHLSAAVSADPTVAADAMADALRQRLTEAEDMRLQALVVGQEIGRAHV